MKRNLIEQLERIHRLNYGNQVIKEGDLWDKIIGSMGIKRAATDNKKADVVSDDVSAFYGNLEDAAKGNGITQQEKGSMNFKKEVESMQIGLILLGYPLPKYGVDGLFGPETAQAVTKFNNENVKTINEAVNVVSQGGNIIGRPGQGTHNASDWQSRNAWDIAGPEGTEVFSMTTGVVSKIKKDNGTLVHSGVKKIYGDQVSIKSTDGKPDIFYTHIKASVKVGDKVNEGDVIGTIMQTKGIPPHVHVGVSTGDINNLATGLSANKGGTLTTATPEMLNKLIELLKQKGIKSEDITPYINKGGKGGGAITVNDWEGVVNLVIDNLEGGYYHPDMLSDGRVKDGRFGKSGETMFGLDRKAGNIEATGPAGKEFWSIIDSQNARSNWKHGYMLKDNPSLNKQLRKLASDVMKPLFINYSKSYLSPESAEIISKDPALTFNFAYATWNGPGWFQKFAKVINDAVASGNKDPKELLKIALSRRIDSTNSLISQGGSKVANVANRISSTSTMA